MPTVSDTGPMIALAKVGALRLLKGVFGNIVLPRAVARELMAKSGPEADALDVALSDFIVVMDPAPVPPATGQYLSGLDAGEREAVVLALARRETLIIDDRAGRVAARALGVSVTGTVGTMLAAKKCGLIPAVLPLLEQIRNRGYWLSEALFAEAAHLSNEHHEKR